MPVAGEALGLVDFGSTAGFYGAGFNSNLVPYNVAPTASTLITSSQTISSPDGVSNGFVGGASIGYSTHLSMADMGLSVELSASRDNTGGSGESANLGLSANSSDFLTFTGVTSGVMALNFFLTGTLAGDGDNGNDYISFMYNLAENTGPYGVVAAGNLTAGDAPRGSKSSSASTGSTLNFTSGFVDQIAGVGVCITVNGGKVDGCPVRYDATGTVLLPFSSSGFSLNTSIQTVGRCVFAYAGCDYTADFHDTALLGGAVIYDANGNVVQGATIVSQSGYDYTQPIPVSAVPEPATFGMTAIALAALAIRLRNASSRLSS